MQVLFVCTANVCRSPMASGLFAKAAHLHDVTDARSASAGFLEAGHPVHEHVGRLLDERGIDSSRMASRSLSEDLINNADLILAMTNEHARGVVSKVPDAIRNVYTFRHFGAIVTPRPAGTDVETWLDVINAANRRVYLGDEPMLDVPDPIGKPLAEYAKLAAEFENTIGWIMSCAYPASESRTA